MKARHALEVVLGKYEVRTIGADNQRRCCTRTVESSNQMQDHYNFVW